MLVITRKVSESVEIVGVGMIRVVEIRGGKVRLAFDIPRDFKIIRDNIKEREPKEDGHADNSN